MATRGLLTASVIFEVAPARYDELVSAEMELALLKQAIAELNDNYHTELKIIKQCFGIVKHSEGEQNEKCF